MNASSDVNMQNLLDAIAAALRQDDDIEELIKQSAVPHDEAESLADLIQSLQAVLVPVEPTARFTEELEAQLMNTRRGVVTRARQMPARVHIAAVLAVAAGFGLIVWRRIMGSAMTQDISEEPIAV